jgi:hypothetical protein
MRSDTDLPARCLYVYGIVDAGIHPYLLAGATRGAELELTTAGSVAAVHSWIDPAELQDVQPDIAEGSRLAELVRRHDDVVMALALAGAVLPVRLGTLLPDQGALTRILADSEQHITAALERVRGHAEWDLRARLASPPSEGDAEEPALARSGAPTQQSGTAYLLGKRDARERAAERRDTIVAALNGLDSCLADLADETAGAGVDRSGFSASRAYLVAEQTQQQFIAAAEEGITELERLGCAADLRGPLPAYAFADVRLEAHRDD